MTSETKYKKFVGPLIEDGPSILIMHLVTTTVFKQLFWRNNILIVSYS